MISLSILNCKLIEKQRWTFEGSILQDKKLQIILTIKIE